MRCHILVGRVTGITLVLVLLVACSTFAVSPTSVPAITTSTNQTQRNNEERAEVNTSEGAAQSSTFSGQLPFTLTLSGDKVVPPVSTEGTATTIAILIEDLLVVTGIYQGLSSDLVNAGVVLHQAPPGENGEAVNVKRKDQVIPGSSSFVLQDDGGRAGTFKGVFRLTEEQIQALKDGLYYLAIHTQDNLAGELRGQLISDTKPDLTAADLVGTWQSGDHLYQFTEEGIFRQDDQGLLLESPDDTGTFQLEGNILTTTSSEASRLCTAGSRIVSYIELIGEDTFREFIFEQEGNCSGLSANWEIWKRISP